MQIERTGLAPSPVLGLPGTALLGQAGSQLGHLAPVVPEAVDQGGQETERDLQKSSQVRQPCPTAHAEFRGRIPGPHVEQDHPDLVVPHVRTEIVEVLQVNQQVQDNGPRDLPPGLGHCDARVQDREEL